MGLSELMVTSISESETEEESN